MPNHRAFGIARISTYMDRAPVVSSVDASRAIYPSDGTSSDCSYPQLSEYPNTGVGVLAALSDSPHLGYKWIIHDIQAWLDSPNAVALHYFLLAPGYSFTPATPPDLSLGSKAPGTIRLGIGNTRSGTEDFTNISGVATAEASPMQFTPGLELENQWRIGVVEIGNTPVTHTLALRLFYTQVPSCAAKQGKARSNAHGNLPGSSGPGPGSNPGGGPGKYY